MSLHYGLNTDWWFILILNIRRIWNTFCYDLRICELNIARKFHYICFSNRMSSFAYCHWWYFPLNLCSTFDTQSARNYQVWKTIANAHLSITSKMGCPKKQHQKCLCMTPTECNNFNVNASVILLYLPGWIYVLVFFVHIRVHIYAVHAVYSWSAVGNCCYMLYYMYTDFNLSVECLGRIYTLPGCEINFKLRWVKGFDYQI